MDSQVDYELLAKDLYLAADHFFCSMFYSSCWNDEELNSKYITVLEEAHRVFGSTSQA
jgi:hypothetical protein